MPAPGPDRSPVLIQHVALRLPPFELERLRAIVAADPASSLIEVTGPAGLARLRPRAGEPVCVHCRAGDGLTTAAIVRARRQASKVLLWERGAAGGAPTTSVFARLARGPVIAIGETPEGVAQLGSSGLEAWLSPWVTAPDSSTVAAQRTAWGVGAGQAVLRIGVHHAAEDAPSFGGEHGPIVLASWAPGQGSGPNATSAPVTSEALPAAISAADAILLDPSHAYAARVRGIAAQLGRPVVELAAGAGAGDAAAAVSSALASPTPAVDPPGAAAALREIAVRAGAARVDAPTNGRPPVAVLAWTNSVGRTMEMAHALGGEGRTYYDLNLTDRRLIPIRYALSSLRMVAYLARRRPKAVVIANPPIFPPMFALAYRWATGARLLLDSQTASFGAKGSGLGQATLPIHRFISRCSTVTLVGAEPLADTVRSWDAEPMVFYEAAPMWEISAPQPPTPRLRVLWIGVFASDEPVEALLDAARQMPEVEFRITGDVRRAPADRDDAPPNVVWLGFVRGGAFPAEIDAADVIVTMTTDPGSALRGGAEAAFARRPLITTDVPFLRELFPHAHHAENTGDGIRDAITAITADWPAAAAACEAGLEHQLRGWTPQLAQLRRYAGLDDA